MMCPLKNPAALCLLAATLLSTSVLAGNEPSATTHSTPSSVSWTVEGGTLRVDAVAENIVHVTFSPADGKRAGESLMLAPHQPATDATWAVTQDATSVTAATKQLRVRFDRATHALTFLDSTGQVLTAERPGGRTIEPATVQGENTTHIRQVWSAQDNESLYGLGQHQLGLTDLKGYDLDLWQHNGTIAVPFLVSSRGYGILWDNNSFTRFGDLREAAPLSTAKLFDAAGKPGGLTARYFAGADFKDVRATHIVHDIDIAPPPGGPDGGDTAPSVLRRINSAIDPALDVAGPISVRWEGSIEATTSGDHAFHAFSSGDIKVWIDGHLVINHWRQGWLPWKDVARVHFEAGHRHAIRVDWVRDVAPANMQLRWKTPPPDLDTSLWSEVGDRIDYFFIAGPAIDTVIAGYRHLTGTAPMMPRWAFGLWQSRQRYETSQQSIDVVEEFRRRKIPFDVIVQDWFYWQQDRWGSHEFEKSRFPDPRAWVDRLHELKAHVMISVWPKFCPDTANFDAMKAAGFLYLPDLESKTRDWINELYTFYDAFNPAARSLFWSQIDRELFSKHVDAWWLDASEPDLLPVPTLDGTRNAMMPTAAGTAARALNAYPLENARGVYEGQRASAPDQRVFILTRSGFAGQQRVAGAVWSGDTTSTWTALAKQVPAALEYSISGLPYWTMDTGGFAVPVRYSRPDPSPADLADWRELNTRWFQFGTFTPMLRVHGEKPFREMWFIGGDDSPAYQTELTFDRLRYHMLPYIYSLAGAATHHDGTFMRSLAFDFPADTAARNIGDEYMFGPALLVSPVTTPRTTSRGVTLPATAGGWFDFWSGAHLAGGQTIEAAAPLDKIPVHVRAGSIVPFGPGMQYVGEKAADPITLYVYTGADGAFTLYEDDGLTYGYERGDFSEIPIRWDNASHTLTLAARHGEYAGMLARRTFQIVLVSAARPVGFSFTPAIDKTITYTGGSVAFTFEP